MNSAMNKPRFTYTHICEWIHERKLLSGPEKLSRCSGETSSIVSSQRRDKAEHVHRTFQIWV